MISHHAAVLAIVAAALALFAWGRWRADLVGVLALVAAILCGAVPSDQAFSGFADPAVAAMAAVLAISAAIRSSGVFDLPLRLLGMLPRVTGLEVGVLGGLVATLSAVMNNHDAYATVLPAAQASARRSRRSSTPLMTAMAMASLLGGLVTVIGTPANLLIATVRRDTAGRPFGVLDFAPVGLVLSLAGVTFLAAAWRLLPQDLRPDHEDELALAGESYTSEVMIPQGSPLIGQTVGDLLARNVGDLALTAIIREDYRRMVPRRDTEIVAGDVLVLACEPDALQRLMERSGLQIVGGAGFVGLDTERIGVVEAVVSPGSELIGSSPGEIDLDDRFRFSLLAIGRRGERLGVRLRRVKLRAGDILVLQGELDTITPTLASLGCLTLAERRLRLGRRRRIAWPALVMAGALAVAAAGLLPIAVALLCGLALLVVLRVSTLSDLYASIAWPIVVLFGTLIPVSTALRESGAADVLARPMASILGGLPSGWPVAATLVLALLVTPLINAAATVLVLGPVVASLASKLGVSPDPYLMAVAVGAACDFLSPAMARSNAAALGPDRRGVGVLARVPSWRLALPLTLVVAVVGTAAILFFWRLR